MIKHLQTLPVLDSTCQNMINICTHYHYWAIKAKFNYRTTTSSSSSFSSSSSIGIQPTVGFGLLKIILPFFPITNSLHLLTPSTWRSLSTSSFHPFLGLPLRLVPSSSWTKIFLGILSSSILSRWPNQLILCPFIHFTIFSPLLISSSSQFVLFFHSSFSYSGPYILLNIFFSKTRTACSSFFVTVHASPLITEHQN